MKKRIKITAACTASLALLLGLSMGAPAMAATGGTSPDARKTVVSRYTTTDPACVASVTAAIAAGDGHASLAVCTGTVTLRQSTARQVTKADLRQARSSMSTESFDELSAAVTDGVVRHKNYSQNFNNITDSETQAGDFYYNGSNVWVTGPFLGRVGSHNCTVDYAVGWTVAREECSDIGTPTQRDLRMQWGFSEAFGPLSGDKIYTIHFNSYGSIWQ
ncbi:hypothetical protein PED38_09690 [Clavibacter sp. CT19]|uniref:hypothetical protein n=1 Tax=Clavibacter sp. CT19 TaxID=3018990 RepID=UPI0022EB06DF|nr:hypothetical protein [Clavibacter sp. CT19]MDA3805069.1 hypothetical protein [Clavibacter sp. CT19]